MTSYSLFLKELAIVCKKHNVEEIYTRIEKGQHPTTIVRFTNGETLEELEYQRLDRSCSAWWPTAQRFIGK